MQEEAHRLAQEVEDWLRVEEEEKRKPAEEAEKKKEEEEVQKKQKESEKLTLEATDKEKEDT